LFTPTLNADWRQQAGDERLGAQLVVHRMDHVIPYRYG
jgi:hypothetical protein